MATPTGQTSTAPTVFDVANYPNAEKAFPGLATAVHTLGGSKEADALAALEKIGEGFFKVNQNGKLTNEGKGEIADGNASFYPLLNSNLLEIAARGGATPEQKNALQAIGGTAAVAGMHLIETGYQASLIDNPDAKKLGQQNINKGNNTVDSAIMKQQGDAFIKAHPQEFSQNILPGATPLIDVADISHNNARANQSAAKESVRNV